MYGDQNTRTKMEKNERGIRGRGSVKKKRYVLETKKKEERAEIKERNQHHGALVVWGQTKARCIKEEKVEKRRRRT